MPENPLLPNARLRALYRSMSRAVELTGRSRGPRLEALLAASLLHLENEDFALPLAQSSCLPLLASMGFDTTSPQPERDLLLLAAGAALALKEAGNDRFAMTFLRTGAASGTEPGWADALAYASQARLPLLVVCVASDAPEPRVSVPGLLTWQSVQAVAKPLHLPVMPVDGEDAVAVYRATQESVLRARQGGGPAVLWCVCPTGRQAESPLDRLRAYLAVRGLARLAR